MSASSREHRAQGSSLLSPFTAQSELGEEQSEKYSKKGGVSSEAA